MPAIPDKNTRNAQQRISLSVKAKIWPNYDAHRRNVCTGAQTEMSIVLIPILSCYRQWLIFG